MNYKDNDMSFYQNQIGSVVTGLKSKAHPTNKTSDQLYNKYSNPKIVPHVGKTMEAVVTGITVNPLIGSYIVLDVYTEDGVIKAYDLLDCPGVPYTVNEERKRRYMTILGTCKKTINKALTNPYALSASLGAMWGNRIKHQNKLLELTVQPYLSENTTNVYFAVLDANVVDVH